MGWGNVGGNFIWEIKVRRIFDQIISEEPNNKNEIKEKKSNNIELKSKKPSQKFHLLLIKAL